MREEFKPKKEELLRKAWKAEWDSMEEPKITWEEFKHRKQRKLFICMERRTEHRSRSRQGVSQPNLQVLDYMRCEGRQAILPRG
jgi:hypothetical protein